MGGNDKNEREREREREMMKMEEAERDIVYVSYEKTRQTCTSATSSLS